MTKENLLFVCSRNQWRSPTAELLFRNHPSYNARSAGTSEKARVKLSQKLISWADYIIVMERKHKEMIRAKFSPVVAGKTIMMLDIEDSYAFNDPELIGILKAKLSVLLDINF